MNLSSFISEFEQESRQTVRRSLADALGVSIESIRCWETGTRKPSVKNTRMLEKISDGVLKKSDLRPDIYEDNDSEEA